MKNIKYVEFCKRRKVRNATSSFSFSLKGVNDHDLYYFVDNTNFLYFLTFIYDKRSFRTQCFAA